jgi:hypothetical protein
MEIFLPTLDVGGVQFTIDLGNEWLFETANPVNFISFNELEETGHDFRMVFDPQTRNIFKGDEEDMIQRSDLKYIILKQLHWMPAFGFVWSLPQNENRLKYGR